MEFLNYLLWKRKSPEGANMPKFFFFSIEEFTKPFAILLSVLLKHGILYFHRFFSILFQYTPATKILYSVPWATYKNLAERNALASFLVHVFSIMHRSKLMHTTDKISKVLVGDGSKPRPHPNPLALEKLY